MRASQRRSDDIRAGRRPAARASSDAVRAGLSAATAYEVLLPQLARLRAALAADGDGPHSIRDVRGDHTEFDHSLADAVRQAFAADALNAPTPAGVDSWVAEGLARSRERELALFAAADELGVLQATTRPNPRWGSVDAGAPSARARSRPAGEREG